MGSTLVLNQRFQPVAIISWQRAITLLFQGKVEVIDEYEDKVVRSVSLQLNVPSIVRFLTGLSRRKRAVKFSRENIYLRDKGKCQYCSFSVPRHEATYDHVIPRVKGGTTCWENVVICCVPCNQEKGGRTPIQAGMRLITDPVKPTKLPDIFTLTFTWKKGMPDSWKQWVRSISYWHSELEQG